MELFPIAFRLLFSRCLLSCCLLLLTTWPNWIPIANAFANPTPRLPEGAMLGSITETIQVINLTRQHEGDIFTANELLPACNTDICVGLSSGTAGLFAGAKEAETLPGHEDTSDSEKCQCRCLQHLKTYREDLGICVDDIHECTLSPFISGSSSEKIPFVFLPLRGQIIHPSREINFPGVQTPICAVTNAQYLSQKGWLELRNPLDNDVPFRLFRDEGRTFLQWLGETDLRHKMQGRLILVHMMCRDMFTAALKTSEDNLGFNTKNIFTPCVAFRVNGNPVRQLSNVPEVLFQSENSNLSAPPGGFHTKEYIVIGICSLILGLIYVASVFLYLHVKKRKSQLNRNDRSGGSDSKSIKNDQVTFGVPFSRSGSLYSGTSLTDARNSQRSNHSSFMGRQNEMNSDEMGVIKNNPLMRHFSNLGDNNGFVSENSNSECDAVTENLQTSAVVHPGSENDLNMQSDVSSSPTQENECLPEANVSITEESGQEGKLDTMKAIVNGTIRKKLYFNPAYFEPHLLLSPPPAAIEFLTKIREVIAIAKCKMASKRYQPSLNIIPEEHQANSSELYNKAISPQSTSISPKTELTNRLACSGCPGCNVSQNSEASKCGNCGDKHKSIQKWLEGVPFNEALVNGQVKPEKPTESEEKMKQKLGVIEEHNETRGVVRAEKRPPPPLPPTAPKIISHSLKPHAPKPPPSAVEQPIYVKTTNIPPNPAELAKSPTKFESDLYDFAKAGSEIYNNPKFIESPQMSVKSRTSSSRRSRKKKIEILDQYSNPGKESQSHYEMLKSIQHMPDMVYEALAKDYSIRNFPAEKQATPLYNIPTPDYDGSYNKKMKDIYNNSNSSGPFVPTPDYSTMSKRSLRQYQPDSPIYRRRSPQYLIVDYETDSLERGSSMKKSCDSSSPMSNISSDISSQPSPSLSTALPLEEEVEVHNTVYDKVEGFRKDGENKKSISSKYDINANRNTDSVPRIKYDTPFRGSMTIEVAHEPESDEVSTDSDQFEPDTLDRKPRKQNNANGSFRSLNAWTEYLSKSQSFVNNDKVSYASLENMTSLPEFNSNLPLNNNEHLILRSTNSFRNNAHQFWSSGKTKAADNQQIVKQNFGSLREIYQSKVQQQSQHRPKLTNVDFDQSSSGRILTLDAKHSKRQRRGPADQRHKMMPPDVIPSDKNKNFYDIPRPLPKVPDHGMMMMRKNSPGWNTSDLSRTTAKPVESPTSEETDNTSNHSESTEVTGVSDTQRSSDNPVKERQQHHILANESILQIDYSAMYNRKNFERRSNDSFISVKIGDHNSYQTYHFNNNDTQVYSVPDSIVQNTKLLTDFDGIEDDFPDSRSSSLSQSYENTSAPHVQNVFRVEVPPPSNGMQIAMEVRDRVKKSKDLKNAWRKFVSIATSRFNGNASLEKETHKDDIYEPKSSLSEYGDEGISSLINEGCRAVGLRRAHTSGGSLENLRKSAREKKTNIVRSQSSAHDHQRLGHRHEMDSGYISGDSNECKSYTQQIYERCSIESIPNSDGVNIINTNPEKLETTQARGDSGRKRPQTPKVKLRMNSRQNVPTTVVQSSDRSIQLDLKHPIEVKIYASDEDQYATQSSTDSDDGGNTEEMCESGAESIETHSVLFKNIRYNQFSNNPG